MLKRGDLRRWGGVEGWRGARLEALPLPRTSIPSSWSSWASGALLMAGLGTWGEAALVRSRRFSEGDDTASRCASLEFVLGCVSRWVDM